MPTITAAYDPALVATVVQATALTYTDGPDDALDRPGHVRAGSSLASLGGLLAVLQDDANFVALIDPQTRGVRAVPLPVGEGGLRLFDDQRGNKRYKLDLEACVGLPGSDALLAFGSGSSPLREYLALITGATTDRPEVVLRHAPELYAALRAATAFAGSELNIEGAVLLGADLRLFNRGNGAPGPALNPVDATCDLHWPTLWNYLQDAQSPPPLPRSIVQYDLGDLAGLPLTFTDAASVPGRLVYAASAEDSPDAIRDGPVAGSALGVFDPDGRVRWTPLRLPGGDYFVAKVEGVLLDPADPHHARVIVDRDDPDAPSELCEVYLAGPWYPATLY